MLSIYIEGEKLFIKKGTAIQLEVKNSIFDTQKIEGDIVFTFDVPAKQNDIVFKNARFVYVQRIRKFKCIIAAGGSEIAIGDLYLQKSSQESYSCGVVVNPFNNPAFPDQKLRENNYGNDLIISSNYNEHNQKWLAFLKKTINEDSFIRFPLFKDEDFYGDGNKEFGIFEGTVIGKLLNRLFLNETTGDILDQFSPTTNVFNTIPSDTSLSWNSYAFAPAFHLLWLLEKVIENAGYNLVGSFKESSYIKNILFQSLRSLDKSAFDYAELIAYLHLVTNNDLSGWQSPNSRGLMQLSRATSYSDEDSFEASTYSFIVRQPGIVDFSFEIETKIPPSVFGEGATDFGDYIYLLFSANFLSNGQYVNFENFHQIYPQDQWYNQNYIFYELKTPDSLTGFVRDEETKYRRGKITFQFNYTFSEADIGKKLQFYWGYITWKYDSNGHHNSFAYIALPTITNATIYTYKDTSDFFNFSDSSNLAVLRNGRGRLNIYDNKIKYSEHMPNLTNSEFLNMLCSLFGLSFYIDSKTKQIEVSFFKDVLRSTKVLDLSKYVVNSSIAIEEYLPKKYQFIIEAVENKEIDKIKIIDPVQSYSDLPYPEFNLGKYCFVIDENRYYISEKNESNWVISWKVYAGNNQSLSVGNEENEPEEIKPKVKATENESVTDDWGGHIYPNIKLPGLSKLFETDQVDFDMILLNYLGIRAYRDMAGLDIITYIRATPVCFDWAGNREAGFDITATGEYSLGEEYVKPWLGFLATYETITYQFLFPLYIFLEVMQLLRPQDKSVDLQIRWAMVYNVKLLPISMTFEFREGSNSVLAEIKFAKQKLEL